MKRLNFALLIVALVFWGGLALTRGDDWRGCFYPALQEVVAGRAPYEVVSCALHPLPLYIILLPFAALPPDVGTLAIVGLTVFAGFLLIRQIARGRRWATLAVLASPFMGAFAVAGQVTGLEIAALGLLLSGDDRKSGLALLPLYAVPPNGLLLALWSMRRSKAYALATLVALLPLLVSFAFFGWWPGAWLANLAILPEVAGPSINASIWYQDWRVATLVMVYVIAGAIYARHSFFHLGRLEQALFVLSSMLLISPHVLPYRILPLYILLAGALSTRHAQQPVALLVASYILHLTGRPEGVIWLAHLVSLKSLHQTSKKGEGHAWPQHQRA